MPQSYRRREGGESTRRTEGEKWRASLWPELGGGNVVRSLRERTTPMGSPMMDGEGLFAAILAEPDEDTPRLVYADWLEENDEPLRSELIRVQVAMARAPTPELEKRDMTLRAKHAAEWLAPLKAPGQPLHGGAAG